MSNHSAENSNQRPKAYEIVTEEAEAYEREIENCLQDSSTNTKVPLPKLSQSEKASNELDEDLEHEKVLKKPPRNPIRKLFNCMFRRNKSKPRKTSCYTALTNEKSFWGLTSNSFDESTLESSKAFLPESAIDKQIDRDFDDLMRVQMNLKGCGLNSDATTELQQRDYILDKITKKSKSCEEMVYAEERVLKRFEHIKHHGWVDGREKK
ncbi:unnamed protein product, partial [Mesorhabditis belari]|uniref:Uncharacterized protein n=1 Tax=Mesorhabditis belari TaxID=2138241 RepID=A0AAF3EJJ0_9BILA